MLSIDVLHGHSSSSDEAGTYIYRTDDTIRDEARSSRSKSDSADQNREKPGKAKDCQDFVILHEQDFDSDLLAKSLAKKLSLIKVNFLNCIHMENG
jgi:hypothetical protein